MYVVYVSTDGSTPGRVHSYQAEFYSPLDATTNPGEAYIGDASVIGMFFLWKYLQATDYNAFSLQALAVHVRNIAYH